jgi:hypothetical protein
MGKTLYQPKEDFKRTKNPPFHKRRAESMRLFSLNSGFPRRQGCSTTVVAFPRGSLDYQ